MTREEISKALNVDNNGKLGDMLTDLIYCDFIRKYNVRDKKIKTNSTLPTCRISIPSFTTHLPQKQHRGTLLEQKCHFFGSKKLVWASLRELRAHLTNKASPASPVSKQSITLKSKTLTDGAQIDIIIDRVDNTINLCEVKYCDHEYSTLTRTSSSR